MTRSLQISLSMFCPRFPPSNICHVAVVLVKHTSVNQKQTDGHNANYSECGLESRSKGKLFELKQEHSMRENVSTRTVGKKKAQALATLQLGVWDKLLATVHTVVLQHFHGYATRKPVCRL